MAEVDSMVRVGIVSAVNSSQKTARVFFPDMDNMMSDWLPILQRPGEKISTGSAGSHDHNGAVAAGGSHSHSGSVSSFVPKVNDTVLVLYGYGFNVDGYILGVIE